MGTILGMLKSAILSMNLHYSTVTLWHPPVDHCVTPLNVTLWHCMYVSIHCMFRPRSEQRNVPIYKYTVTWRVIVLLACDRKTNIQCKPCKLDYKLWSQYC